MARQFDTSEPIAAPGMEGRSRWVLFGVAALALGLLLGWGVIQVLQQRPFGAPSFNGTVIQSPRPASDFTLTAHDGRPVSLSDFRGKVVLLYFGYTFCPDVCPATMLELARATELLDSDAAKTQVMMVSLDPERDTPQRLEAYVQHFHPSFLGLSGTASEIMAAATPLGIFYEKHAGTAATGYLIDHTASVVVIDPEGYLRLVYPFNTSGEAIAADVRQLVNE